ncbi:MAG: redox-regulated ATPase YchF [Terriglobales bacterium]
MKTGIIGLPQVGKTSLFKILTKAQLSPQHVNPREAHVGVAKVPDDRLDRLAALYNPRKLMHAAVEYVDVAAMPAHSSHAEAKAGAGLSDAIVANIRQVDAIAHVVRAFDDPAIAHVGEINPLRDIQNVDFDLMVSDLGQVEKRLERLQKDLKKQKTPELEREFELLQRCTAFLEQERPLREMAMTPEDKKRIRGFMFLSEKPVLHVLNIGESPELGRELGQVVEKFGLKEVTARPRTGATAIAGKVEAELAEMSDADAAEFLSSYGMGESGLTRLIRKTYELLGLISFFTVGEDECRAWTIEDGTRAVNAAGVIHTDLEHHFIRAEVIRWDQLLEAGSEANARARGTLRLEGKDYVVKDGESCTSATAAEGPASTTAGRCVGA